MRRISRSDAIIDEAGTPLVLVPGIQGRWEYIAPAVDALAALVPRHHVLALRRAGSSGAARPDARASTTSSDQIAAALDSRGIERAIVCGVSFGGLVALRFAARQPERTTALVLVSTPGPGWHLQQRHELYARLPWLFGPLFSPRRRWRLRREIAAAIPGRRARLRFAVWQLRTVAARAGDRSRGWPRAPG